MIIAGARGHGLEVFQLFLSQGVNPESIFFFDEDEQKRESLILGRQVLFDKKDLQLALEEDPNFCLGVGNPSSREKLTLKLENLGGRLIGLQRSFSIKSILKASNFDQMAYSFVGPLSQIGKGVLINTRANIHHECVVGELTEIGPGAILLGAVKVGKNC